MDVIDQQKETIRSEESESSDSESEEDSSQTEDEVEEGEMGDTSTENETIASETGSEDSHENESTEQETENPCPSCKNNMTVTSLQTCPHCKWQGVVKGFVFLNKALVCDICQHNFPANSRSVRETFHCCNHCGLTSQCLRRDYCPSDGEDEN